MLRVLLLIFLFLDACWGFWADRQLRPWKWARVVSAAFTLAMAAWVVLTMVRPHAMRRSHGLIPTPMIAAVYLWHLLILPLSLLLPLVVRLMRFAGGLLMRALGSAGASAPAAGSSTRRQFVGAAAVALPMLATTAGAWAAMKQLGTFRIRRMTLRPAGLPAVLDGLTIAHVSDIHTGHYLPAEDLPRIVEAVNALDADLVLLTGDLIDFSIDELPAALEAVKAMKARWAVAMCVGNHDLFDDPDEFVRQSRDSGVPFLYDQSMIVPVRGQNIELLGIRWSHSEAELAWAVTRLARHSSPDAFPLLMAHHPHAFDSAAAAGLPLTLSGHTHGGQLMLTPHIGAGPMMFRYWSGLYTKGTAQMVVSNGVGNWFPLRINAPAEIVHITLRAGV